MNKLIFSLLLGLLFTSCQNTPKTAADDPKVPATELVAPAASIEVTPEAIQEVSSNLASNVKMMESLRKEVDALPAKVKKEKSAEIEGMYATLDGMIEKQNGMLSEIKTPTTASAPNDMQGSKGVAGPNAAELKDYIESAARYAQEAQGIKEAVQKMAKN